MARNTQELINAINKADEADQAVSNFFAAIVGRVCDAMDEFAILVLWLDAIDDGLNAALELRNWVAVDRMDKMRDECNMWLDHWNEKVAPKGV
jgi:type VI protein secretion system component VasF